jgi:hypothetical protein
VSLKVQAGGGGGDSGNVEVSRGRYPRLHMARTALLSSVGGGGGIVGVDAGSNPHRTFAAALADLAMAATSTINIFNVVAKNEDSIGILETPERQMERSSRCAHSGNGIA